MREDMEISETAITILQGFLSKTDELKENKGSIRDLSLSPAFMNTDWILQSVEFFQCQQFHFQ